MKKLCAGAIIFTMIALASPPSWGAGASDGSDAAKKLDEIVGILQTKLNQIGSDLKDAASAISETELDSAKARDSLTSLCQKHPSFVDCGTVNPKGIIVALEPASSQKFQGRDISALPQFIAVKKSGQPVVSDLFMSLEGFYALNFQWPILPRDGKKGGFKGSVSVLTRPNLFIDQMIKPAYTPNLFNAWVMQLDGRIIYGRHPEAIGEDFLPKYTGDEQTTLPPLVERMIREPQGQASYQSASAGKADGETRWCVWKTISFEGHQYRVVVFHK